MAQLMLNPAPIHWLGVKRILRYLKGTMETGLTFQGSHFQTSTTHHITGWSDADWAGDPDTRRSISIFLYLLDSSCLLSWQSQKQHVVALSSTEAEYIAAATATKELLWLQALVGELQFPLQLPSTLFCDNLSCIALTKNPRFHNRSKHISIRFCFL